MNDLQDGSIDGKGHNYEEYDGDDLYDSEDEYFNDWYSDNKDEVIKEFIETYENEFYDFKKTMFKEFREV